MPLSDFTVSDMNSELGVDPLWAGLTLPQQIGIYNSITQQVANLYRLAKKSDYQRDNLAGTPGSFAAAIPQAGYVLGALAAGSAVVFNVAFAQVQRPGFGDYKVSVSAFNPSTGQEIGCTFVQTPTGLTVKPDFDGATVFWEAIPFTQ